LNSLSPNFCIFSYTFIFLPFYSLALFSPIFKFSDASIKPFNSCCLIPHQFTKNALSSLTKEAEKINVPEIAQRNIMSFEKINEVCEK